MASPFKFFSYARNVAPVDFSLHLRDMHYDDRSCAAHWPEPVLICTVQLYREGPKSLGFGASDIDVFHLLLVAMRDNQA